MKILATVLLFLATAVFAQNTPVVALGAMDAAQVAMVHNNMLAAEKDWADLQKDIEKKYLVDTQDWSLLHNSDSVKSWEFSKDFRYIVPKPAKPASPSCNCWVTPSYGGWTYPTGTLDNGTLYAYPNVTSH